MMFDALYPPAQLPSANAMLDVASRRFRPVCESPADDLANLAPAAANYQAASRKVR